RFVQPNTKQGGNLVGERRGVGSLSGSSGRAGGSVVHHARSSGSGKGGRFGPRRIPRAPSAGCVMGRLQHGQPIVLEANGRGSGRAGRSFSRRARVWLKDPG